jgi:large subunit ribosomal protein L18
MDKNRAKWVAIATKKQRIRKTLEGDAARPRLSVYRSEAHIYGQIIDDITGKTLVAASSVAKDLRDRLKDLKPMDAAKAVGEALAEKAQKAGVTKVVFDRNGRRYGGRIQALAEAARGKGLQF